ncbi:MAG: hypothetical protein Q7S21_00730 [archaeon]|nr:hypothetical protein [archaeon]
MNKKEISKEVLQDLYLNKKLSLSQIAKQFGFKSKTTTANYMKKFGIARRPSDRKNYPKKPFSGDLQEKAYLLGLRAGDIHARKHYNLVAVYAGSTKEAQINMIKECFEKYSHLNIYDSMPKRGAFTNEMQKKVVIYLHPSFGFIIKKPQRIDEWILIDEKLFYSFLSGYCDSESSWILTQHKKYDTKWKDLIFSLGSCDKKILEQINQKLIEFGFNSHFYLVREKGIYGKQNCNFDLYRVMLMRHKDVTRLAQILLPISKHADKINAMSKLINYENLNDERKLLKKQNLGTIDISCVYCGHKKIWKNGVKRYNNTEYLRFKCPSCKKEFQNIENTKILEKQMVR